jgi:CubicO group peptidase (beta-lactamase class C family)
VVRASGGPALGREVFSRVDALVREVMDSRNVSGVSIALVAGNEIVWSQSYGCADVETGGAVTPAHRFSAMSVTKPVVATALIQLHERG